MAAGEKICEFSDAYEPYRMYNCKRNHIQVLSEFRHEFRGKKATLYIFENELVEKHKCGVTGSVDMECINPNPSDEDYDYHGYRIYEKNKNGFTEIYDVIFRSLQEYKDYLKHNTKERIKMEYQYYLHVPDVPGKVRGLYMNFSTDMTDVKRRLRRLVGTKNLTVKYMKGKGSDFYKEMQLTMKD